MKLAALIAKTLIIIFTLLTLVLIGISFLRPEWIKSGLAWIGTLIESLGSWNYLIAFVSAGIESLPIVGTVLPGMNIMILVGGFWGKSHFAFTALCAILGAMIGNYLGYWIGKWYGKEIIRDYGDYLGIGRTESDILHRQIEKNGFWYIVLGKFHNFTRAFVPFIAGMSGMNESRFWLYNMIGSVFWALSILLIGVLFVDHYESILDNIGKITTVIMILIIGYITLYRREDFGRYWHAKQREIEEKMRDQKK